MFRLPCTRNTYAEDDRVVTVVYEGYAISVCKQKKCVVLLLASAIKIDDDLFQHFKQVTKTQKELDVTYDVYALSEDTLKWCETYVYCNTHKIDELKQAESPPPDMDFTWMTPYQLLRDINNAKSPSNKAFMCAIYHL